ncbi:hypothetical protein QCA50_006424 [Cerrena zonata]|uniref:Uncharacterized protein n=1 Tax=Cerrena zonata TaxID=2478898 RepID=A0AAW0GL21_9APHY
MFVDWFVGDGMYETVEEIVVRPMQRFHLANVGRMIKAVGPNLKRFEIALIAMQMQGGFDDVFATSFSLEPCVNLTSLTFGSPGGYSVLYHTDDKSCRWIEIMLSQITSKVISEISFWVDEEDVVKIRTGKWDGIISLLLSKKFGSLKKVELKLREDNKMVMDAVESFMKRRLNKLHVDGVLVFVRNWRPPDI